MEFPIKGACQCGNVSYTLFKKPKMVIACHCTECQKLSTSPFSVTAVIASSDIEFSGRLKEWSRNSESGNVNAAKFCPDCGNRVYQFNPNDMDSIKLKLKPVNLSDDSLFEPSVHVWTSEKVSWYKIPEGVKAFEKQR